MKLLVLVLVFANFFFSDFAEAKKKKRKKRKSQIAVVQIDSAAVYKVPNFDSPIIAYLNKGKKIRASKKVYPGIGGLGSFYKVRVKKGKYGYVTDVDLFPTTQGKSNVVEGGGASTVFTPTGGEDPGPPIGDGGGPSPIYSNRYIGLTYNMVNFTEEIAGQKFTENLGFFGVKVSGPGALFTSMPLELNILVSLGAPSYYDKIAEGAEGFAVIADLLFVLPFLNEPKYMLYYGLGPVLAYNSFVVQVIKSGASSPFELDSQTVNLGVAGVLGFGYSLGQSLALKLDAKYIYEEQGYFLVGGGLQIKF